MKIQMTKDRSFLLDGGTLTLKNGETYEVGRHPGLGQGIADLLISRGAAVEVVKPTKAQAPEAVATQVEDTPAEEAPEVSEESTDGPDPAAGRRRGAHKPRGGEGVLPSPDRAD